MDSTEYLNKTPSDNESEMPSEKTSSQPLSTGRTILLISTLNATVLVGAMNTANLTVSLPRMTIEMHMSNSLLLWPALIYSLACGCTLLLAGAIADIVGNRTINLLGTFVLSSFILASGLARTGLQLIIFRAFQGIGVAMCFPTAVSVLSAAFPSGRMRNIGFSCLGLGTPIGFAIGILLGGWFGSISVGWRVGFYLSAVLTMMLFAINCWCLPNEHRKEAVVWSRLRTEIDWIGVLISSISMGLLSYCLAVMAGSLSSILEPANILLFLVTMATIPLFVLWMHVQETRGNRALIPNSLWNSSTFSAICVMVLLSWATLQSMEWFLSLFYQQVQHLSSIETAIRYLPNITAGSICNILTGLIVHRISVKYLVVAVSAICACAPLLMAVIDPTWPWWWCGFWVMLLLPTSVDVNFTVANLIITDIFPVETQALAGAVYQVVAQIGTSIGIAVMAVVSNAVTDRSPLSDKSSPDALMQGYRAVFWACFAMMVLSTLVGAWGLRGVTMIGKQKHNRMSESQTAPELPPLKISSFRETISSLDLEVGCSANLVRDDI